MPIIKEEKYPRAPFRVLILAFGCGNCGRHWKSAGGSLTDYQICKRCYEKCYPGQYKMESPNKKGNQNRETFMAHDSELCGKCIRLGYSCMEQGVEEEQITVVSNDDGEDFRLEKTDMSSFFEIEPTKKNNKKKKKDVTIAAASISKSQLKKKKVDESTRMFFKDTATDKKSVAVAISTGTVDVLSKHVENLDIRDKEDLNKKSIQVDKTIAIDKEPEKPKVNDQVDKTIAIDKEPEKPKVNDQVESPTNLESINDDSENSSTTDGASTNTDMKENTESESQDEENEHSTSEVHSKDINDSNDNNESAEKEISDHIEKKNLSKGIQLTEELSKDLNDTAGSDNMHK